MRVLDTDAMRRFDQRAIEGFGVPALVLMENAAIGIADAVGESFPEASHVAVFCGPGNNGGDGLALGRHLTVRGYRVSLWLVTGGRSLSEDAGAQLKMCRSIGLEAPTIDDADALAGALQVASASDVVVDALFGTGLTRPLEGLFADVVSALNDLEAGRLAVDLPSGLDASRASVPGPCFQADLTVSFAAPKIAHVLPPAAAAVGRLAIADLGVPGDLVAEESIGLELVEASEIVDLLPARLSDSHKGDHGHVLVVAGSPGKSGAAVLAARAAVRAGAGLVTVATSASVLPTVDAGSIESMTAAVPSQPDGELAAEAAEAILALASGKQAVALGPGLGISPGTTQCVRDLCARLDLPLVLDADGLNALAGRATELAGRPRETILTPHPGELGRLLDRPTSEIVADRIGGAREAASLTGAVVVLKGHRTLVASPDGDVWINPTGNAGMATGGSGDVLTGLLGALLGQGLGALPAAILGVYWHGLAGDLAAVNEGLAGLRAGDLVEMMPDALRELEQG